MFAVVLGRFAEGGMEGGDVAAAVAAAVADKVSDGGQDDTAAADSAAAKVVLKARGLIRLLMWLGNLRRKRAVCASFNDSGCRAMRLSHKTEGLVSPHMG